LLEATRRIAAQTRQRLAGITPDGATRRVSLHDADARPIAKGRLGKPVEFGYKAQVTDNHDGIVVDHNLEQGNPADAPQLAPAIGRVIRRTGRRPRTVTADRGYGQKASMTPCTRWACATWSSRARAGLARPAAPRSTGPRQPSGVSPSSG
jgi:transposase, IS5 family